MIITNIVAILQFLTTSYVDKISFIIYNLWVKMFNYLKRI